MARHRADTSPVLKRRLSLSLAVLVGAPMLALGPVSAATAADITTTPSSTQEATINQVAAVSAEQAPAAAPSLVAAALDDEPVLDPLPDPVDPTPVDPDPLPVDPTPVPVDPTPGPVDPTPGPVDPTPVPVDPTPVPVDPTPPVPVNPTPAVPVQPVVETPVAAPVAVAPAAGAAASVVQQPATVVRGASGAAADSQVAAVQTVPVEELAYTGSSDSNAVVAGIGLVMVGAGAAAVALGRGGARGGRGRRAAIA